MALSMCFAWPRSGNGWLVFGIASAFAGLVWSGPVPAAEENKPVNDLSEFVNSGTVGVISGGIGGTYVRIAADIAATLNAHTDVRALPIVGQGSLQNITDLLYLKGIDVAIVQSDVLDYIEREKIHPNIKRRINYVTKLYNEEFHVVAGRGIVALADLAGRKVNFGVKGSGTYMTATTVFAALGIEVEPVSIDQPLAMEKIRRGEIAASIYVAGRPAAVVAGLRKEDGFKLLPDPIHIGASGNLSSRATYG